MDRVKEILGWLSQSKTAARVSAAAAKLTSIENVNFPEIRIALLRNVTLEPIKPYIEVKCFQSGLKPNIFFTGFSSFHQDVRNSASELYKFRPDIIIVALRLNSLVPNLTERFSLLMQEEINSLIMTAHTEIVETVNILRYNSTAMILVHNFERPLFVANCITSSQSSNGQINLIHSLNIQLVEALNSVRQAFVVDIDQILAQVGYEAGLDDRFWHIARAPYALNCLERLASVYVNFARALKGKNKKCLILDADNTLWGGIVGEDGLNGIKLSRTHPGSGYYAFQSAILEVQKQGVILALCSKNNEHDVLEVMTKHPDCLLRPQHFVSIRINWNDKVRNILDIARELNLGLDSFVFIDDSDFECDHIRETLPEVSVIQLPRDPTQYERIFKSLDYFDTLMITPEDRSRTIFYQNEGLRRDVRKQTSSYEEYLQSLEMTLTVGYADDFSIPRIAQLTQKTNQFNLTTRRYTESDIYSFVNSNNTIVYYTDLQDRFDSSGIIGVVILCYKGTQAIIDSFLLSCRVIARGVEDAMIAKITLDAKAHGCTQLIGEYYATTKNSIVAGFYPERGFEYGLNGTYCLLLNETIPKAPTWFKSIKIKK